MRIFIAVFVTLFTVSALLAQHHDGPYIVMYPDGLDYGEIPTDEVPDGKINFSVINHGNQPLVLTTVRACCGTRVNSYTQEPIAPADTGYVEVQFRIVPRPHRIRRTVTIQSNAENRQTAIFRIQGEVVEPKGDLSLE